MNPRNYLGLYGVFGKVVDGTDYYCVRIHG